jgi:hypothetical protein
LSHAESIRREKYDKENQPTKKTASRFLILACEKTTKLQARGKSKRIQGIRSVVEQREEKSNIQQKILQVPTNF